MHVRVLGAAAGGAFPQWNCSCTNCRRLRQGGFCGQPRSQAQLAISSDRDSWYLINASPDLRYQIESFPPLHPHTHRKRHSPIIGVVLLSAEVDAALGLLLLRESQRFTTFATPSVRKILLEDNTMFHVLRRQPDQVQWTTLEPGARGDLNDSGIFFRTISTGGSFPGFVSSPRAAELDPAEAVSGLVLAHAGRRLAVFPGASEIQPEWLEIFESCEAVLFDGTFWSDDELIRLQDGAKTARQMGHHPVEETLRAMANVSARKIFLHINNTNPILDEDSEEFRRVRDAGWEVAFDGMEFEI